MSTIRSYYDVLTLTVNEQPSHYTEWTVAQLFRASGRRLWVNELPVVFDTKPTLAVKSL